MFVCVPVCVPVCECVCVCVCVCVRACGCEPYIPDGDVVCDRLSLEQGEVDVNSVSVGHCDDPAAVLGVGVLIGVLRGIDGPVVSRDVVSTGG